MLPQKYPFAFLEREGDERGVPVRLTATGRVGAHRPLAQGLALEILAQAALVQLLRPPAGGEAPSGTKAPASPEPASQEPEGRPAIAGFDDVRYDACWARRPPRPGDELRAITELLGRFGPMLKVRGRLERDGESILEATLLLVSA